MKKVVVISLGGSMIIPDKINIRFLEEFKKVLLKNKRKYKFVVVCGGGSVARKYIDGLDGMRSSNKKVLQSHLGVAATRLNARFMTYFFGKDANKGIPREIKEVVGSVGKNDIVFCGALRYGKKETSDSTAAKLARVFNSDFVNLTNVHGLFDKNPKKYKNARFIPEITHDHFLMEAKKIEFKPGQHFVLDQTAAKIIKNDMIKTIIIGPNVKNLDNLLNGKHFVGTVVG